LKTPVDVVFRTCYAAISVAHSGEPLGELVGTDFVIVPGCVMRLQNCICKSASANLHLQICICKTASLIVPEIVV
jgi:hypothetical protein